MTPFDPRELAPALPLNRPVVTGRELEYIESVLQSGRLAGDGPFTQECHRWLERHLGVPALLTHSCTAALEVAALLLDLSPGDEVIMPSFTFVSTANAFVLRGAVPVFVDIRPDTLNLDERLIEEAITPRTKAIVPVHYAGVACEMDTILDIAERHGLDVVEDAAHAIGARYRGRALGAIGHLGALSFHETKNISAGEGGALMIRDSRFVTRAEVLREKGTNRSKFFRGEIDRYSWVDLGSSFLPNELTAACLYAQFQELEAITERRLAIWRMYHEAFAALEAEGLIARPHVPGDCQPNGHLYYLLLRTPEARDRAIALLRQQGVGAAFHYVPLDDSPAGRRYARAHGSLEVTHSVCNRLVRLPLWPGLEAYLPERLPAIVEAIAQAARQVGVRD